MKKNKDYRSGYIALIGRTNVGKSTFLNAVLQMKVAIISDRPQTTRKRILGIKTTAKAQMIFFDCPGVHRPQFKLNERMMKEVNDALLESDLILYFVEVEDQRPDDFLLAMLKQANKPVFLVINKIDRLNKVHVLQRIDMYQALYPWREIVPISALQGDNLDRLLELIEKALPCGENFFDAEQWTQQSERYYLSELIREKLLQHVRDELPYITLVTIEEVKDRGDLVYVRADIGVETASQKKIVIGRKGGLIKQVGQEARRELEDYFGKQVLSGPVCQTYARLAKFSPGPSRHIRLNGGGQ